MINKTNTRGAIESDFVPAISGVSQNTELGPLMFVLYISSIISSGIHIYSFTSAFTMLLMKSILDRKSMVS